MNDSPTPDLSGILSQVMSNPTAMNMLSSLLGGMGAEKSAEKKESCPPQTEEKILPPCPKELSAKEKRRGLLLALKPFLSAERQQTLDRILMISEALALLKSERKL